MAKIATQKIGYHDLGSLQTLQAMRRTANQGLVDPLVVETARAIVRVLPPRDTDAHARALRAYLFEHFQFVRDPVGVELVATPHYLLSQVAKRYYAQGDCDDVAVLGATLAKAVGLRARYVVARFWNENSPFTHVFTIVRGRSGWLDLDVTRPARGPLPPMTGTYEQEV